MRTDVVAGIAVIVGAVLAVRSLERIEPYDRANAEELSQAHLNNATPGQHVTQAGRGFEVKVQAARDAQFYVTAEINRSAANFLIDTGASYVALRDSDARKAGVYTSWADYKFPVRTANGETKAAMVTLDALEINGIIVTDVKAFVLPDEQLAINLLGMSFLSRLESVEARAGELVLRG